MRKTMFTAIGIMMVLLIAGVYIFWQYVSNPDIPILENTTGFTLDTANGETYQSDNGKVKLVAFFYTNCPDICPLTMMDFTKLQEQLTEKNLFGEKVELVAITLDPEVDTPEVIRKYAAGFNADSTGWKFLTGTKDEIQTIANSFHMTFQKVSGGFIAHNTTMFLVDGENQIRGLYDMVTLKKGHISGARAIYWQVLFC
jgi:protein SCO1